LHRGRGSGGKRIEARAKEARAKPGVFAHCLRELVNGGDVVDRTAAIPVLTEAVFALLSIEAQLGVIAKDQQTHIKMHGDHYRALGRAVRK
jgi:hypothetical protein